MSESKSSARSAKINDLRPDPRNANKGTQRGLRMLDTSLRKFGAGRSILVDKNGAVIAGNKTLERAADLGMDDVIIVQTDGRQLVAVQRTDLDLETDTRARELAYADNRVGQVDLEWDSGIVIEDIAAGVDLSEFEFDEIAGIVPDFQPVDESEQPRLDQKKPVVCPGCGLEFTLK